MKVLITGGMGVIGAEASRRFVREGHRPIIFARHRDEWLIRDILEEVDIELGDVLDMPRLLDVIKRHRVTHIVHAAAFVGAVSAANPALSVQVNVMGMVNVLEAARAFDVARVVYTSAKGIYGPVLGEYGAPTYKPVPEDLPKNPKRNNDSARGIYLACTAENPNSRVYNIGTGVGVTLNDIARVIRKHLPRADIEIGPGLHFLGMPYPASSVYDISRARAELGYAPQYDLERGIADYLESLERLKVS